MFKIRNYKKHGVNVFEVFDEAYFTLNKKKIKSARVFSNVGARKHIESVAVAPVRVIHDSVAFSVFKEETLPDEEVVPFLCEEVGRQFKGYFTYDDIDSLVKSVVDQFILENKVAVTDYQIDAVKCYVEKLKEGYYERV